MLSLINMIGALFAILVLSVICLILFVVAIGFLYTVTYALCSLVGLIVAATLGGGKC